MLPIDHAEILSTCDALVLEVDITIAVFTGVRSTIADQVPGNGGWSNSWSPGA